MFLYMVPFISKATQGNLTQDESFQLFRFLRGGEAQPLENVPLINPGPPRIIPHFKVN